MKKNRQIKDAVGNDYARPRDVVGETRAAFTSHADSAFDVCFENVITGRKSFFLFLLINFFFLSFLFFLFFSSFSLSASSFNPSFSPKIIF